MLIWDAHSRKIDALAFSPDGRTLALAGSYLACRLLDATDGRRLWTVASGCTFGLSVAFGPDGTVLCRDRGVSVRTAADGAERWNVGQYSRSFGVAADGRTVFAADGGHQDLVRRYDIATGGVIREIPLEAGTIYRVAVSPDGRFVALVGCKRFYLLNDKGDVIETVAERGLSSGSFVLCFGPDSRTLVFSAGRTLFVWDTVQARETRRVQLESKHFMDAAFTPDGRRLVTASKEGVARVWEVPSARPEGVTSTWTCERSFAWDVGPLRAVAIAPDGTRAAVAGDSGRVVVWDLEV
jgi:WD40 repeat protein